MKQIFTRNFSHIIFLYRVVQTLYPMKCGILNRYSVNSLWTLQEQDRTLLRKIHLYKGALDPLP